MTRSSFEYDPTRDLILDAIENGFGEGDEERLQNAVEGATHEDLLALLEEFFDVPEFVVIVYECFRRRGATWPKTLREKLVSSLMFAGYDSRAEAVRGAMQ